MVWLKMTGYRKRTLGGLVRKDLTTLPVVAVMGLRQAGKGTFLQNELRLTGREFLSLDEFAVLEAARRDPQSFVRRHAAMKIDEARNTNSRSAA